VATNALTPSDATEVSPTELFTRSNTSPSTILVHLCMILPLNVRQQGAVTQGSALISHERCRDSWKASCRVVRRHAEETVTRWPPPGYEEPWPVFETRAPVLKHFDFCHVDF